MVAPVLAGDDGALGFWAAVRDVFPDTREQRCWFHLPANVLNYLPKSAQPGALKALQQIYNARDCEHAQVAVKAFEIDYATKWPKAAEKTTSHVDVLLEFFKYPAEHWVHLRTTDSSRVDFRDRPTPPAPHQRPRFAGRWPRDGLQAHGVRPRPLADSQRPTPARPHPSRSHLPQGQTHRTTSRPRQRATGCLINRSTGLDYCSRSGRRCAETIVRRRERATSRFDAAVHESPSRSRAPPPARTCPAPECSECPAAAAE